MELQEAAYWGQVVMHGLNQENKRLARAKPVIDRMSQDEFVAHGKSARQKIYRAWQENSIHPLRELTTKEKAVMVRDLKSKAKQGITLLSLLY